MGATSGDVTSLTHKSRSGKGTDISQTGSAAICSLRGKKDVSIFILHPKGRVSPIQEAQMRTVLDKNVHNLAVTGTFDDCQVGVEQGEDPRLWTDSITRITSRHCLATLIRTRVNSINWSRLLAQIVYYFHSYFSLAKASSSFNIGDKVRFVIPTLQVR